MKRNKGHKSNLKIAKENKDKLSTPNLYKWGNWQEKITNKHLCLYCNRVESHEFICCGNNSYNLHRILRTPKGNKRYKWKKFYTYLSKYKKNFLRDYSHLIEKYNLDVDIKWENKRYEWNTTAEYEEYVKDKY